METASNINKVLQENQSIDEEKYFELYTELAKYRDSSLNSSNPLVQARRVSYARQETSLRRSLVRLLAKARKPALDRLTETKEEAMKKASEEKVRQDINRKFEHYQELINRVQLRELQNRSHEIEFERQVHQLLLKETKQTSQIIHNPPKGN